VKSYIKDLVPNEEVTSFFLVSDAPQVRKSKKGTDYLCVKLYDKTGDADARVWDVPKDLDVPALKKCIVKVRGRVETWMDQNQIQISQIRRVTDADEVDLSDFFERSPRDPEDMWKELRGLVGGQDNGHVRQLLFKILDENERDFKRAPAAKSIHHGYLGGLLEHVLSMCWTALALSDRYALDKSLMVAACVLHDVGKTKELSYEMGIAYTVEGTLLGHISMGMEMTSKAIDQTEGFPRDLKMVLLHLIASHHGLLEFGSPKVPLMKEAIAFHLVDMLDSRMAICDRVLKNGIDEQGLSDWSKELGGPLYKMLEHE
jgi:3'-5' exoribonuclease